MIPFWEQHELSNLAQRTSAALADRGLTLAVAESCTGGMLSGLLTEIPGASAFFMGGVIAYHNQVKTAWLGVPESVIAEHGAVSRQAALVMAEECRKRFRTDLSVSITGIAGPDGGSREKPVGLVYVAVATRVDVQVREARFAGTRTRIRVQAVEEAMSMLLEALRSET